MWSIGGKSILVVLTLSIIISLVGYFKVVLNIASCSNTSLIESFEINIGRKKSLMPPASWGEMQQTHDLHFLKPPWSTLKVSSSSRLRWVCCFERRKKNVKLDIICHKTLSFVLKCILLSHNLRVVMKSVTPELSVFHSINVWYRPSASSFSSSVF